MRSARLLLGLGCAVLLLAGAGRAAEDTKGRDSDLEQARQHAAQAKVHYDLGEFERAAEEYILVYRLRPLPALLFNIAQSYRQAGQYEKSKQFYQAYLRENPDAKTSAAVKKALKEIEELQAKEKQAKNGPPTGVKQPPDTSLPIKTPPATTAPAQAAATTPPPSASQPTPPPAAATQPPKTAEAPKVAVAGPAPQTPPKAVPAVAVSPDAGVRTSAPTKSSGGTYRTAAWIAGGTAVALLAGGGLFMAKAGSTDSSLQSGNHTRAQADSLINDSNSQHKMSAILLGAGIAAAATSAVLFFAF